MKRTRRTTVEPTKRGVMIRTKTITPKPTVMRRSNNRTAIELIPGDLEIILVKPLQKGAIYFQGYLDDGMIHFSNRSKDAFVFQDEDQARTYAQIHNCVLRIPR